MSSSSTFLAELRAAIHPHHVIAEGIPFSKAVKTGVLSKASAVALLRTWAIVRGTLEHHLSRAAQAAREMGQEDVATLLDQAPRRLPHLLEDLETCQAASVQDVVPAIRAALQLADTLLAVASTEPAQLLGILYVLEGQMNGGRQLAPGLLQALELQPPQALSYLTHGIASLEHTWPAFLQQLERAALPTAAPQIIAGACEAMDRLTQVVAALHPIASADLGYHVTRINPEAGDHVIPCDPVAISVALSTARQAWMAFGYLEQRFGERGRRFAASDAAWLVSMSDLSQPALDHQLAWLADLLAVRGLPPLILEVQLHLLADQLPLEVPGRREGAARLDEAARAMGVRRLQAWQADRAQAIQAALPADVAPRWSRLGDLVASALSEESLGRSASAPLLDWLRVHPDLQGPVNPLLASDL